MMARSTWAAAGRFHKRFPSAEKALATLQYVRAARAAGVPTPAATWDDRHPDRLSFELIPGESGGALVRDGRLADLLAPLRRLNVARIPGLVRFEPFRHIDSRSASAPPWLRDRIEGLRRRSWEGTAVVHGDFHPGQVVRTAASSVWLVDLDDLALAPPEADLGNLVAYLATDPGTAGPDLRGGLALWSVRVAAAWSETGSGPDADLLGHFRDVALIRRALKLSERGRPDVLADLATVASAA